MGNLSEETIRDTLNASAVTSGSVGTSGAAVLLSTPTTRYTGGIVLTNASATAAEIIWVNTAGTAAVAGDTSYPLLPGASLPLAMGDLHDISVIAASGTPRIGWIGTTL